LALWQRALILFEQAPLFGQGFDSFAHIMDTVDLGTLDLGIGSNHPHSAVMQLLAEGGLTALAAFALLFGLAALPPGQAPRDRWRTAARLGTLAAGVTGPAIGLNLWSDVTAMLVIHPLTAFALFVPVSGGRAAVTACRGGTAPAPA
jgi:O-antigen ligase